MLVSSTCHLDAYFVKVGSDGANVHMISLDAPMMISSCNNGRTTCIGSVLVVCW